MKGGMCFILLFMTIVRNLPEQLILAHAPWLWGGFLIVCILACSAAGLALLFSGDPAGIWTLLVGACLPLAIFSLAIKRDQVIFDGIAGTITLQRRSLWRYSCQTLPLSALKGAELDCLSDSARPMLNVADRPYVLVEAHRTGDVPRKTVERINTWHQSFLNRKT